MKAIAFVIAALAVGTVVYAQEVCKPEVVKKTTVDTARMSVDTAIKKAPIKRPAVPRPMPIRIQRSGG